MKVFSSACGPLLLPQLPKHQCTSKPRPLPPPLCPPPPPPPFIPRLLIPKRDIQEELAETKAMLEAKTAELIHLKEVLHLKYP